MQRPSTPGRARLDDTSLAFVNTASHPAGVGDRLWDPQALRAWLDERGLLTPSDRSSLRSPSVARMVLSEALILREQLGRLFAAHSLGRVPAPETLFAINRVLELGPLVTALDVLDSQLRVVETREVVAPPLAALAHVARAAARLVTGVAPARLRACAAEGCGAWFVDTSKGGRRRWCSMARCGNRTKAARHRQKRSFLA